MAGNDISGNVVRYLVRMRFKCRRAKSVYHEICNPKRIFRPTEYCGRYLQEILEDKTNGRIELVLYENKQLANSDREKAEMVQMNILETATVPTSTLAALSSNLSDLYIYDFPYMFHNNQELFDYCESDIGKKMLNHVEEEVGIKAVNGFQMGWQKISNNTRPITKPEDMEGLKIRTMTSNQMMDFVKFCGGSAAPISYGEVYTALQQKTIDGMMTSTGLYVTDGFWEVQKYLCPTNQSPLFHILIINQDFYNSLPDDLKSILDECLQLYVEKARVEYEKNEEESLKFMEGNGIEISKIEDIEAFYAIGDQVNEKNKDSVDAKLLEETEQWLTDYRVAHSE